MNSSFNCLDKQSRIGPENVDIFDENFLDEKNYIINAVDNIDTRKYIDNQCTFYEKPLIESGTLGTKAHIQTIIPHITIYYNDSKKIDTNPLDSIPICTLHNFPAMIENCIEWGRELFNSLFTDNIIQLKNWAENKQQFYKKLETEDIFSQLEILNNIKNLISIMGSNNFEQCINNGIKKFTEFFDHKICKLIDEYPENHLNKDGSKFWSGSKRFPHSIKYNPDNELSFTFVKTYSVILARTLGISIINNDEYIKSVSKKFDIPKYIPKTENNNNESNIKTNEENPLNNYDDIELLMEKLLQGTENEEINSIK
jgi:ubiquitin-activating enzyme E1